MVAAHVPGRSPPAYPPNVPCVDVKATSVPFTVSVCAVAAAALVEVAAITATANSAALPMHALRMSPSHPRGSRTHRKSTASAAHSRLGYAAATKAVAAGPRVPDQGV